MGAKRLVLTMVVLGGAAGAALALTTVPSFSPYREREARTRDHAYVAAPEADPADAPEPQRYAYTPSESEDRHDGFGIAPGPREGTIILELPRWAEGAGSWFAFGQRALDEWGFDADRGDEGDWQDRGSSRRHGYADRGPGDERSYGYAPHGLERDEDEPEEAYAPQPGRSRWVDPEDPAFQAAPTRQGRLDGSGAPAAQDSAADAAARAREAARDVRAAEDAAQ